MKKIPVEIQMAQPGVYEAALHNGERVVLFTKARWPRLEESAPGIRRINRYYDTLADRWKQRWEGQLLQGAKLLPVEANPWRAELDFTVTVLGNGLFSVYLDVLEDTGQRRPRRVRLGDVWQVPAGVPVTLRELLPWRRWWRGPVLAEIRRQIGERIASGESVFYEDWLSLCSRRFSAGRFYLDDEGPVVFYPIESIAPALEGYPSFSLSGLLFPSRESNQKELYACRGNR